VLIAHHNETNSNIAELREYVICDLVPGASKSFRSFLLNPNRKAFPSPFAVPGLERVDTLQCMERVNKKPSALLKLEEMSQSSLLFSSLVS